MSGPPVPDAASEGASCQGGAPVVALAALPPSQACAVRLLREWCDGACAAAPPGFDDLARLLAREGRRPLMRHQADCACVGSDEAVFALLLAVAATGDREEAMMLACLLVPADRMGMVAHLAQIAGLAIARACLAARGGERRAPSASLH